MFNFDVEYHSHWLPLESNPEVFNEYLTKLGVDSVQLSDVYGFDKDVIEFIPRPHLAMILCFPEDDQVKVYRESVYDEVTKNGEQPSEDVFFMIQKISNACGCFALFHSLANLENKVDLGNGPFKAWLDKAKKLNKNNRSQLLGDDKEITSIYESCAIKGDTDADPSKVVHHFITYVNVNGFLYEVDSSMPFPRPLGPTSDETLFVDAGKEIQTMIQKLENISFSALALVGKE